MIRFDGNDWAPVLGWRGFAPAAAGAFGSRGAAAGRATGAAAGGER